MNASEILHESFRLGDGRRLYRMTHLPTGATVEESESSDEPVVLRWEKLMILLVAEVETRRTQQQ
jgi:hypothetical protein